MAKKKALKKTADITALEQMTEAERQALLEYSKSVPEAQVEINEHLSGNGSTKSGRIWSANPEIIKRLTNLCQELMGPGSPYQFFHIRKIYDKYRQWQDEIDSYGVYATMKDIKLWIRRWIWETDADWEEKSSQRRNLIPIQYQFGTVTTANTGFGKKQLDYSKTHGTYGERFVDSRTVWEPNS